MCYIRGNEGEKHAEMLLAREYIVTKAKAFHGDLKITHRVTGKTLHIEVKNVTTNRVTIRKQHSQHLIYADYVVVFCKGNIYSIPREEISATQKRLYLSPTSKYGKFLVSSLSF